jgi:hypothetical protein
MKGLTIHTQLYMGITIARTVFTFVIAFIPGRMIRHQTLQNGDGALGQ